MYKLDKEITLYKQQFEKFVLDIFGEHRLERLSLDIDGILFRIKYMVRKNVDMDKLPELKSEFISKAIELRSVFGEIMYRLLLNIIGLGEFSKDDIVDLHANDVKIDNVYVKFKLSLISKNRPYLEYIEEKIGEEEIYNLFPNDFFRFYVDSYNDGIAKAYPELFQKEIYGEGNDAEVFVHNFTFQTTESCNLNCTYCYQHNKSPERMTFGTAKKFIDELLQDNYGYINKHNSPAIILEFIGGDPLLEIHLTRRIYEYFLDETYRLDHPWFNLHRLSLCTNGMLYFDRDVQSFFQEYAGQVSFNISIDGNNELHDACRIQPNGEGSYDVDMVALNHFNKHHTPERNSKMTLAPSNMKYLSKSVISFIENGMKTINLNCVFEEGWTPETALLEYNELKKVADYLLENDLENLYISIFDQTQEDRALMENDGNFCGGTGSMLSLRPNGQFYPCIRYMPSSTGDNAPDLCIGSVEDGMVGREQGSEVLKLLDSVTRRSQSNDICYDCPIGNSCAWCSALGHEIYGTPNKRPMFICIQMIAEALANVYYWNNLLLKHPQYNLHVRKNSIPDKWALLVIDEHELYDLKLLECATMVARISRTEMK